MITTTPALELTRQSIAERTTAAMEALDRAAWEALMPEIQAHNAEHLAHLAALVAEGSLVDVAAAAPGVLESGAELHLLVTRAAWEAVTVDEDGPATGASLAHRVRSVIAAFQAGKNPADLTRRRFTYWRTGPSVALHSVALLLSGHSSIVIGLEAEALG